ncbi:MAG: hypothetical protein ABSD20_09555 [Terriglobales bacterium]|jgi:hypothetical protein
MSSIASLAGAAGRVLIQGANQNRFLRAGIAAVRTTALAMGRVLHLLFLQIVGLFFCIFALGFAARIPRAYQEQLASHHGRERTLLLAALSIMFGWFAFSSFWRARAK